MRYDLYPPEAPSWTWCLTTNSVDFRLSPSLCYYTLSKTGSGTLIFDLMLFSFDAGDLI